MRAIRAVFAAGLVVPAALFFLWSIHWPLVGDASLIHYIAFLIERGWAPYRQLGDMNMPGSFLIEMAAMHIFGMGDLGWRLFDFALMLAAGASFWIICDTRDPGAPFIAATSRWLGWRSRWFAPLFAACLFIVIHGRDGLAEGGQRDLTMAVCLVGATAFLFLAVRSERVARMLTFAFVFGVLSGIALTIKPTAILCSAGQLGLATLVLRRDQRPHARLLTGAALGALLAPAAALALLLREEALPEFLFGFGGILPYYASLGHRSLGFVILHSVSPVLLLVLLWIALTALLGRALSITQDWERSTLLIGVAFGLLSCIVQARGLPYYRYPLLAFLLPLIAIDCETATRRAMPQSLRARSTRWLAVLTLGVGSLVVAPQSALVMHRFRPQEIDFISTLQQRLTELGGPALSGRVQCIDSISGCGNVLYRMRLEPATGVLSDFLLFGPPPGQPVPAVVRDTREQLVHEMQPPPSVIIVTSHLHIDGPDDYLKLARWPAFAQLLASHYTLDTEWKPTRTARWWSREETPAGYRIYHLRPEFEPHLNF